MEKQLFFDNLHNDLAKIYKTSKSTIVFIRSNTLGNKNNTSKMLSYLREKIKTIRQHPNFKPEYKKYKNYVEILKFINRNQKIIKEIAFKTKFDK